ncbi:MAG TPA: hypothetical protein VLJ86_13920 [Ramlibacter sp.]|nr:hypothetical protein [Ramlibacter sp.]
MSPEHLEAIAFGVATGVRKTSSESSELLEPLNDQWAHRLGRYIQDHAHTLPFATSRALASGFVAAAGLPAGTDEDEPEADPETPETA